MKWRKNKRTFMTDRDSYGLWDGASRLAVVAQTSGGWYWYGDGVNSLCRSGSVATLEEAKIQARAYIKEHGIHGDR